LFSTATQRLNTRGKVVVEDQKSGSGVLAIVLPIPSSWNGAWHAINTGSLRQADGRGFLLFFKAPEPGLQESCKFLDIPEPQTSSSENEYDII
jgi:hypothetical protein